MLQLPKPQVLSSSVFNRCKSGLAQHSHFDSIVDEIENQSSEYLQKASVSSLWQILPSTNIGIVKATEMSGLYVDQMSDGSGPARHLYDMIRSSTFSCPLCAHQKVATLDHYLPKSRFPAFAVNPLNLVPCCRDCNTHKSTSFAKTEGAQTFHPYFDDFTSDQWLFATVIQSTPPALKFHANPPSSWSPEKIKRPAFHLTKFHLHELYEANAANELANIAVRLIDLNSAGGTGYVQQHLQGEANSRFASRKNSWQTAMYTALANCNWFCSTGYLLIR